MKTRYPNVYQDKNGKYFYQIFIGTDANGKKKLKKVEGMRWGIPFLLPIRQAKKPSVYKRYMLMCPLTILVMPLI